MFPAFSSNGSLGISTTAITSSPISSNVYKPSFSIESGTITFGTYTFAVDQLGELFSKLLLQYPELAI